MNPLLSSKIVSLKKRSLVGLSVSMSFLVLLLMNSCKKDDSSSQGLPVLSTSSINNISINSAISGGDVTEQGSSAIISKGIVWGTSSQPTTSLSTKTDEGPGTGIYTSHLAGLIPSTKYYVRAYATNAAGTAYGNELNFTTDSVMQVDIPELDAKITAFMTAYDIAGASLAVSKNGKLVYMKGYGLADKSTNEPVSPDNIFRLASVSKTYTAVAIMKLYQDGKLDLDAKVFGSGSILGEDYGTPPYKPNLTALTIRELLQHTSGAWGASTGGDVIDYNPDYTNKQMLDWIIDTRPMPSPPGTVFDYSNINYFILGRIIEKVSGKSYTDFLKTIFTAIGAANTGFAGKTLSERKPSEVAYYGQGTDAQYVYNIAFPRRDADAGIIATAKDLLKLVTAIDGFDSRPDILNAATISQFITPSSVFPGYACGIGRWQAQNLWFNDGSLPGTRTWFMRGDNGMCAALLLNSRPDTDVNYVFSYAMQDVVLDVIKNTSYSWQDIDQF
ncbi:MAG: beta-lactamase family protein [Bacteroidetes bacterium]|nr:beta-lactamase family protein [Bacteroidota bacterium]